MDTNQNADEKQKKNSVGPSTALAYLDPHYWYQLCRLSLSLLPYSPLSFSLIASSSCCCCCCFRDERFSNEEHYEWFKDYTHFRHLIQAHIKPTSSVLPFSLSLSLSLFGFICCVYVWIFLSFYVLNLPTKFCS